MNKVSKGLFKFAPVALASALVISGCSSNNSSNSNDTSSNKDSKASGEKVTLTMSAWGNPAELKVYQRALDAYEEKNPNVTIKLVPIPSDAYEQKLMTQLQGGQGPDIFYVGDATISKLAANGSVAELSEFMESSESYAKPDEFAEGLWGAAKKDGKIYGITVDCNPLVMYYNENVFEAAGVKSPQAYFDEGKWNWDAFNEVTKQLKDAGKNGFIAERWVMNSWIWSNGGLVYDENGQYVMNQNEKAKEAVQFVSDLTKKGQIMYAGSLPKGQGLDAMFMSDQVGLVAAGNWLAPMFSQNPKLKFDFIPWPTNTGNKTEPVQVPTAYMAVNAKSKALEEAKKFATFYTSKEGQEVRLSGNGNAIPSISGIDNIVLEGSKVEHAQYLMDARETGIAAGAPKAYQAQIPGLSVEIEEQYDLLLLGKQDVETTIKNISEVTEKMTKEYEAQAK